MIGRYWRYPAALFAFALLGLSIYNASWLAKAPPGTLSLVALGGVSQLPRGSGEGCTASRIEAPMHRYLANTLPSLGMAKRTGAAMVSVDIVPTKDGRIALFSDANLDCRTDGTGEARAKTLAELKALDAGHGYTADGGKTYPFRGQGIGAIPSLEEALAVAGTKPLLYTFTGRDAGDADLLAKALAAAGRDPQKSGDAFTGPPAPVARARALYPKTWAFSRESVDACTGGYLKLGWFGVIPEACRDGTIMVPLGRGWAFAGWPNKLQERMASVGARVVLTGPAGSEGEPTGLDLPEQLRDIPSSFTGYVWTADIWTIGPTLHPVLDKRSNAEAAALEQGLAARRARRD